MKHSIYIQKRRIHILPMKGVIWYWKNYFRCTWRIVSAPKTNFIRSCARGSGCTQNWYSMMPFCRASFHESHTCTKKNRFVVDKKASKLWLCTEWQLWLVYSNPWIVTFRDNFEIKLFSSIIWHHMLLKNEGFFSWEKAGSYMLLEKQIWSGYEAYCRVSCDIAVHVSANVLVFQQ